LGFILLLSAIERSESSVVPKKYLRSTTRYKVPNRHGVDETGKFPSRGSSAFDYCCWELEVGMPWSFTRVNAGLSARA
jgi:hypothetical protein